MTQLRQDAMRASLAWFDLDLEYAEDKAGLLALFRREFRFPETFGVNWDALADCLQDFSWRHAPGYIINLMHATRFAGTAPQDFSLLLEILDGAASYWKEQGKIFIVLVDCPFGKRPAF